jgi:hypothetical protein
MTLAHCLVEPCERETTVGLDVTYDGVRLKASAQRIQFLKLVVMGAAKVPRERDLQLEASDTLRREAKVDRIHVAVCFRHIRYPLRLLVTLANFTNR